MHVRLVIPIDCSCYSCARCCYMIVRVYIIIACFNASLGLFSTVVNRYFVFKFMVVHVSFLTLCIRCFSKMCFTHMCVCVSLCIRVLQTFSCSQNSSLGTCCSKLLSHQRCVVLVVRSFIPIVFPCAALAFPMYASSECHALVVIFRSTEHSLLLLLHWLSSKHT